MTNDTTRLHKKKRRKKPLGAQLELGIVGTVGIVEFRSRRVDCRHDIT
jgi:hypothetical protein